MLFLALLASALIVSPTITSAFFLPPPNGLSYIGFALPSASDSGGPSSSDGELDSSFTRSLKEAKRSLGSSLPNDWCEPSRSEREREFLDALDGARENFADLVERRGRDGAFDVLLGKLDDGDEGGDDGGDVGENASRASAFRTNSRRSHSRRSLFSNALSLCLGVFGVSSSLLPPPRPASAIGPVKVKLVNEVYSAVDCPKDKPIPGEKAMKGMRGMCVTVSADVEGEVLEDLEAVGVYGFVNDATSGDSVLANNPDNKSDAGQFSIIPLVSSGSKSVEFEFVAAVPREKDLSQYPNGIGPLKFASLRLVSFPGGQQYGAVGPCEMNEFSDECEAWEEVNGPYKKGDYMVKSNPRTKGR